MLGHYLLSAARHLRKHRSHTLINVFSLALSLAALFLILLYVLNELSYDRYHRNANQIYRVLTDMTFSGTRLRGPMTSGLLAPALTASIPEIRKATRLSPWWIHTATYENQEFRVEGYYAEPGLFELFSFPFVSGSIEAFEKPYTALLTQSTAEKLFRREDPVGKVITIPEYGFIEVVGVLKDTPKNSHFTFDILVSFNTLSPKFLGWGAYQFWTYVLLPEGIDIRQTEQKLLALEKAKHWNIDVEKELKLRYALQPLTSIYFADEDAPHKGDIRYVYGFSFIALLILLMACANYVSLTVARVGGRLKELGMRKVFGADRMHIALQFFSESMLMTMLAIPLCLCIMGIVAPLLGLLTDKVQVMGIDSITFFILFLGAMLVLIAIGGSYPAWIALSSNTADSLRGKIRKHVSLQRFQKGVIGFQFTISAALIVITLLIQRQMHFIRDADPGFDQSHVVLVKIPSGQSGRVSHVVLVKIPPGQSGRVMKEAFKTFPEITHASASIGAPGALPGMVVPVQVEGAGMAEGLPVRIVSVDEDFIPTLGIRLLEGRNFSADRATDGTQACIINEAAVRQLGLTSPVNQSLSLGREKLPVIGVVRDFHFESFHNNIAPLIFRMIPDQYRILVLRVSSGDLKSVLPLIEGQWQQFAPGYFFSYSLLEDDLAGLYQKEYDLQSLFLTFSAVAMMIACLGVLGLSAFLTGQRSKEIALRRVVGASMRHIIALIAGDFLLLVGLSTAIASPVAYYFMQRWLQDFAYRVQIDLLSFVWAGLITAALTLITVGSQVIKVARANPVETLRYQH